MKGYISSILLVISIPTIYLFSSIIPTIYTSIIVLSFATVIIFSMQWQYEKPTTQYNLRRSKDD